MTAGKLWCPIHDNYAAIPPVVRLSLEGYACVHCGTIMGKSLVCSGCGWVDPLTKSPPPSEDARAEPCGIKVGESTHWVYHFCTLPEGHDGHCQEVASDTEVGAD